MRIAAHRRLFATAICAVLLAAALVGWSLARSTVNRLACLPVSSRGSSLAQGLDSGERRAVAGVVGSGVSRGVVYVTAGDGRLYVGGGRPFRWTRRPGLAPGYLVASTRSGHRDAIYARSQAVSRSINQGRSWRQLSCALVLDPNPLWLSPRNANVMYLAANAPDSPGGQADGGLYATSNSGRTWRRITNFPSVGGGYQDKNVIRAVAADPRNSEDVTVGAEPGGVFRSTDGGKDWSFAAIRPRTTTAGPGVWSLAYGPGPTYFLWAGTESGVFRRSASGVWQPAGLPGENVWVVPDARLSELAFAFPQYGGSATRSVDGGKTWRPMEGLPKKVIGINVQSGTDVAFAWSSQAIYRSNDHGKTWVKLPPLPIK